MRKSSQPIPPFAPQMPGRSQDLLKDNPRVARSGWGSLAAMVIVRCTVSAQVADIA